MDGADQTQLDEISALQAIYPNDFFPSPPPKVWKGAARLPEYTMRISHAGSRQPAKVFLHLNVKYPKLYPEKAAPILTIVEPLSGITKQQQADLQQIIRDEAQKMKGGVMVFDVISSILEWMGRNINLPPDGSGSSLASEMEMRTSDEQRAQQEREKLRAKKINEVQAREAEKLRQQISEDFRRREEMERLEKERTKARRRAMSDVTERPAHGPSIERFDDFVTIDGVRFDTVKLFHGRPQHLGVTYSAEPICEDGWNPSRPLELHAVDFESNYYSTNQGRKKLRQVEAELDRLDKVRTEGVLCIYKSQLKAPRSNESSRLIVLMEKQPSMTLRDVLLDCDRLREDRAIDYLGQILRALNAIHTADLLHRNINVSTIGLVDRDNDNNRKNLKLMNVAFYTKLNDLNNSDPFGPKAGRSDPGSTLPDEWLSDETVEDPLLYTRSRDIHAVGVVLLQMLMGIDVVDNYPDPKSALNAAAFSPAIAQLADEMLTTNRQRSCMSLLSKLSQSSLTIGRSRPISIDSMKTPLANIYSTSPENGYFRNQASKPRQASRWREDWTELEVLGRGGYGSVVKARNKIDNRIYAVKKIKLLPTQADHKIFREVNALSRLTHRFIVRYFTTWLEETETASNTTSSSGSETGSESNSTSVPTDEFTTSAIFSIDLDDMASTPQANEENSFPSVMFQNSNSGSNDQDDDDDDGDSDDDGPAMLKPGHPSRKAMVTPPPLQWKSRTLYIQMEYVERQTLKELIAEGISEDEAWRLFQQIVDALAYMFQLSIIHRDIKCTNIFIDSNGDCKIGDFGLATSSLTVVQPTEVQTSPSAASTATDMTFDVGTAYYIAPEVKRRVRGLRDQSKADMYSLGIVFFEMNHRFGTAFERDRVLEALRKPEIVFPADWDSKRTQQKQIITWLLQHNPADRPSALQLAQSPLMPDRIEHEYFKEALQMMTKPGSAQYQAVLEALFGQTPRPSLRFLYDAGMPEHASLRAVVVDHLVDLFRLHGAVDVEIPLFLPLMKGHIAEQRQVHLIDRHGDVVTLPVNALVPFARLAARTRVTRIKRYHVTDIYKEVNVMGHPKVTNAAVFDIITPDLTHGPTVASAELISMMNRCLDMFPNLSQTYDIHVSHSKISEAVMSRLSSQDRDNVVEIIMQTPSKASTATKRASLLKKGISSSVADELVTLSETYEGLPSFLSRLDKLSSPLQKQIHGAIEEMQKTIELAILSGVMRQIYVTPLMLGSRHDYFRDGVCFEVCRRSKRHDLLAAGGRYDHLISQLIAPTAKVEPICAFGVQISIECIAASLAAFQSTSVTNLVKEQRSFGYWSARRCDVYIVSFQPGHLYERLEVAALLWQHGISADLMYESGVADANLESFTEICHREGILFTVYPRPRTARREMSDFKVKSVLRGTEYEVSRQELVGWLEHHISEQKRIDLGTSGVSSIQIDASSPVLPKEHSSQLDVQLILPGDAKKQRKQTKQMFFERAYENIHRLKSSMQSGSIPMVAIDAPPAVFEAMSKNDKWVDDDEAWRSIAQGFPTQHSGYASQVRDMVARKKEEGVQFLFLFAVKEEKMALINF